MEENSQAPSSIGSMSLHRLNAPALRQIDMIERYVERWQPPQCSVGATSAAENSDITSQREGEVEDFVQVMQQQHPHGNKPTHHHRAACVRSPTRSNGCKWETNTKTTQECWLLIARALISCGKPKTCPPNDCCSHFPTTIPNMCRQKSERLFFFRGNNAGLCHRTNRNY